MLDVLELLLVGCHDLVFVHEPLLLSFVLSLKLKDDVLLLLLQLSLQLGEAVLDVVELDLHQSLKLFLDLPQQTLVLVNESVRVVQHLPKVNDVLLQGIAHLFNWHKGVSVVIVVYALGAHAGRACLAKVVNDLVWMFRAWN